MISRPNNPCRKDTYSQRYFFSLWVGLSFGLILPFCLNYTNWYPFLARVYTVSPPYSHILHSWIQPTTVKRHLERKKNTRKFQKANLNWSGTEHYTESTWIKWCVGYPAYMQICYMHALHDFMQETWASTDLGSWKGLRTNHLWIPRDDCIL